MVNAEFLNAYLVTGDKQIDIKYQATVNQPNGDWSGQFFVDTEIPRGEYQLVAEDGRQGTIIVEHVYPNERGACRCEFNGLGHFEKA